jgi:hypothetical protein
LTPTLTRMPTRIKTTMVETLSEDNQYSILNVMKISVGPEEREDVPA